MATLFPGFGTISIPAAVAAGVSVVESMILPGLLKMVGYSDSDLGYVSQAHMDHMLGGAGYIFLTVASAELLKAYIPALKFGQ